MSFIHEATIFLLCVACICNSYAITRLRKVQWKIQNDHKICTETDSGSSLGGSCEVSPEGISTKEISNCWAYGVNTVIFFNSSLKEEIGAFPFHK